LGEILKEFDEEVFGEMFDCIKSEATKLELVNDPDSPLFDFGFDLAIRLNQII
jgi:hypothetical protein